MLMFLDIDGVMVPAKSWKAPELLNDGFPRFSDRAVSALQSCISEDTTVMLTTSHKSTYSIEAWKDIFQSRGLQINKLQSLGENATKLSRKEEIVNWMDSNQINEEFVIIDDDTSLNDLPPSLKENLVLTSSFIGLTEQHLPAISAILNQVEKAIPCE